VSNDERKIRKKKFLLEMLVRKKYCDAEHGFVIERGDFYVITFAPRTEFFAENRINRAHNLLFRCSENLGIGISMVWKTYGVINLVQYKEEGPEMKKMLSSRSIISRSFQKAAKILEILTKVYQSLSGIVLSESKEIEVISGKTIKDDYHEFADNSKVIVWIKRRTDNSHREGLVIM
jgi:hypothetical protein